MVPLALQQQHPKPLKPLLPSQPWEKIGTNLFEWEKVDYLLVVDYYSHYIEIAKLTSTSATTVITHLKSIFSRHEYLTVMSDNGPQYSATAFEEFSTEYGFTHITSSPKYPQANGAGERAVKNGETTTNKESRPLLRNAHPQIENGYSPAELLMGRKLRTTLPMSKEQLQPSLIPKGSGEKHDEKKLRE